MTEEDLLAKTKINANGRVVIPAAMRQALGLKSGDEVLLRVEDGEIRLYTYAHALESLQAAMRPYIEGKTGLVDEFIRERRAEARREQREWTAQKPRRSAAHT